MIGALAGKPKSRGRNDASNDLTREVWGKPDEIDVKKKGTNNKQSSSVTAAADNSTSGVTQPGAGSVDEEAEEPEKPKVKADFGLSGLLATDEVTGNVMNGEISNMLADAI
jgi:hypothetical protein